MRPLIKIRSCFALSWQLGGCLASEFRAFSLFKPYDICYYISLRQSNPFYAYFDYNSLFFVLYDETIQFGITRVQPRAYFVTSSIFFAFLILE